MVAHTDVMTQLDNAMLDLYVRLTYLTAIMPTVGFAMILWALRDFMVKDGFYRWWMPLLLPLPLVLMPTLIGLGRLVLQDDSRLLEAAPGITANLLMTGAILLVLGGGLWDVFTRYRRDFRF